MFVFCEIFCHFYRTLNFQGGQHFLLGWDFKFELGARLTHGRSHNREPQSIWVRGSRVAEATIVSRNRPGRAATQAAEADNWEAANHPWSAATQAAKAVNWEAAISSLIEFDSYYIMLPSIPYHPFLGFLF